MDRKLQIERVFNETIALLENGDLDGAISCFAELISNTQDALIRLDAIRKNFETAKANGLIDRRLLEKNLWDFNADLAKRFLHH